MLLGVTGGIAAYKAAEVVRRLTDRGVAVQVLMTRNATQFIAPLTLATLSGRSAWTDEFPPSLGTAGSEQDPIAHIDLVQQASAMLIAPATANTIAKIAHGIADNLLTTTAAAWQGPALIAPAMNQRMYEHPAVSENLRVLERRGFVIIEPDEGWLACGESGRGRLASASRIVAQVMKVLAENEGPLSARRVVVTAGGTREALDPVRFISNASTGTLALKCALALALLGARIDLVCGSGCNPSLVEEVPAEITTVTSAAQMKTAVEDKVKDCDALLMLAAVADYTAESAKEKIKKDLHDTWELKLHRTEDILSALSKHRDYVKVGASLETEDALNRAREKMRAKGLDAVVAVDYRPGTNPYGEASLLAAILTPEREHLPMVERTKDELANEIARLVAILVREKEKQ